MKKNTIVVSFAASKGGVGKSTLATVLANYLHNKTKYSVAVIDADWLQETISTCRADELKEEKHQGIDENSLYPIVVCMPDEVTRTYQVELEGEYDVVIVDLPGSVLVEGVVSAYEIVDHIFIPTKYGRAEVNALINFLEVLGDMVIPVREKLGKSVQLTGLLNDVNVQVLEYKEFNGMRNEYPIPFLTVDIPRSDKSFITKFSTIETYKYIPKEGLLIDWCKEVMGVLNLSENG